MNHDTTTETDRSATPPAAAPAAPATTDTPPATPAAGSSEQPGKRQRAPRPVPGALLTVGSSGLVAAGAGLYQAAGPVGLATGAALVAGAVVSGKVQRRRGGRSRKPASGHAGARFGTAGRSGASRSAGGRSSGGRSGGRVAGQPRGGRAGLGVRSRASHATAARAAKGAAGGGGTAGSGGGRSRASGAAQSAPNRTAGHRGASGAGRGTHGRGGARGSHTGRSGHHGSRQGGGKHRGSSGHGTGAGHGRGRGGKHGLGSLGQRLRPAPIGRRRGPLRLQTHDQADIDPVRSLGVWAWMRDLFDDSDLAEQQQAAALPEIPTWASNPQPALAPAPATRPGRPIPPPAQQAAAPTPTRTTHQGGNSMSSSELQTGNGGADVNLAELAEAMADIGNWTLNPKDGKDLKDFLDNYLTPLHEVFQAGAEAFSSMAETLDEQSPVASVVCEALGQLSTVLNMCADTAEQLPEAMRVGNHDDLERMQQPRPSEQLANVADN